MSHRPTTSATFPFLTVTFENDVDAVSANQHAKVRFIRNILTRHTHWTDSTICTTKVVVKNVNYLKLVSLLNQ